MNVKIQKTNLIIIILSFLFTAASCFKDFDSDPVPPQDSDVDQEVTFDGDTFVEDLGEGLDEEDAEDLVEEDGFLCGNGVVEGEEECDDGNQEEGDGCDNDCTYSCTQDLDCNDDKVCNGDETCDIESHTCQSGTMREDGIVCLGEPRRICLGGECVDSLCGDGFIDTGGGESCEPPNEGRCGPFCKWQCELDEDCPDDGNICNGEEYCNTDSHECDNRNPPDEGTECAADPRMICIARTCQESMCGDSFIDDVGGEECDDGMNGDQDDGCRDDCIFTCHDNLECDDGHECSYDICDTELTHMCSHPVSPDSLLCRSSVGDCDIEEYCDGVSMDCPVDVLEPGSTQCRAMTGDCDVAEYCTGTSAECPVDSFEPSSTECRPTAGPCDVAEFCTGISGDCPGNGFEPASTVCRPSTGICDIAERCSGSSADCPSDAFEPSSTECRPSVGDCDVAEHCSGSSGDCPGDAFEPSSTVCRASSGNCDIAERCSGSSADCPSDAFEPSSTVCRSSAGMCDIEENCTGTSADCPTDTFEPASTVCRPAVGPCDVPENCTGSSPDCPAEIPRTYNYETPIDATASSEWSSLYRADYAVDGTTARYWVSRGTPPEWIYFDLGSIKCMDGIRVYFFEMCPPMTMNIEVSDNASSWTTVMSGWTATVGGAWITESFGEVSGRYLRLYETATSCSECQCTEIEIHTSTM